MKTNPHPASIGDIVRERWPVESDKSLNLYLGTGRCGGCFDSYGLQHLDSLSPASRRISKTVLTHGEVWHRGRHGLDNLVPLAALQWVESPTKPSSFRQHLEIADGRLTTEFVTKDFRYTLTAFTNPAASQRDLLFFHLTWNGIRRPQLTLVPVPVYVSDYSGDLAVDCTPALTGNRGTLHLQRGNSHGVVIADFRGEIRPDIQGDALVIDLDAEQGSADIVIGMGPVSRIDEVNSAVHEAAQKSYETLRAEGEKEWSIRWGNCPLSHENPNYNQLAWRSAYHLLCSYAPDVRCPAPPNGFTGNAWGYHFPQDLSYIHPALLKMGHVDITKAHVEFYHSRLENQLALTQEIYKKPGICWSWEFPIGPDARLFSPDDGGAPNEFQYEIHNAACPVRMAVETAEVLHDPTWTREIAWPIICESARFLHSGLALDSDGKLSLQMTPSMGQDEFGGSDAKNYLCALFAAEYTLTQAVEIAESLQLETDEIRQWRQVLKTGFSYDSLLVPEYGFYAANGTVPFQPRQQKHPVQLNPFWHLPLRSIDEPTKIAYQKRRTICSTERDNQRHADLPTGFYDGWTLFAFQLSAARMDDAAGLAHERWEMIPSRLVDPDFIAIYESSGYWQPYYTTSMGLYLQAMMHGNAKPD